MHGLIKEGYKRNANPLVLLKQTLKFKIQPNATLFTAINPCSRPLRKQKCLALELSQKVVFVCCDWQISIHFCGRPVVAIIMIDSSKKHKLLVGLKLRVCMLLKYTVIHECIESLVMQCREKSAGNTKASYR